MTKSNFQTGKIKEYENTKGWISGSFFPTELLNHDDNVEIKIEYLAEPTSAKRHYHKFRKSWVLVLAGEIDYVIDNNPVNLTQGDFIIFGPNITEEVTNSKPGTVLVCIHSPSGENDKVEL